MPEEIILIAAVTVDGFIARHNNEITNWTKDLKLFKKQTLGHTVIVGSNTYDTLSKDLPDTGGQIDARTWQFPN